MTDLSHGDVRELLGAYALHAVDDDERAALEQHLESCPSCRTEVAEHREVAGLLASGWLPAPEGLWDRISSSLEEAPPPMRAPVISLPSAGRERERRRRRFGGAGRAVAAVGIAASVAVIGLLGAKVVTTSDRVDDVATALHADAVARLANAAAARPDAREVDLRSPEGGLSVEAVLLPDGSGYLVADNLPPLPPGRTYQLWAVVGPNKISVGVLGADPGPAAFHTSGPVDALAITEEEAGGAIAPRQPPRVVGAVA